MILAALTQFSLALLGYAVLHDRFMIFCASKFTISYALRLLSLIEMKNVWISLKDAANREVLEIP